MTFSDTVFNYEYFAYELQICSPLYRKHFANAMNYPVGKHFAHAMNYPIGNASDTHHIPVLTC